MQTASFWVAKTSDIKNGGMKQVTADGTDILLARVDDTFYAVAAHCTHWGGPLVEGALCGKHVICPWHHARFDITNGDLLEPPALDALPKYEVSVDGDDVLVVLPVERSDRRIPRMARCDTAADARTFVILGGGAAGYTAAQTLREDGFRGRIVMVTQESKLPYDRPNLSKDYLQGEAQPEWIPLRPDAFYTEHQIEILENKLVRRVDHQQKNIVFDDGRTLQYDTLLVATGGIPRKLNIPGANLENVFTLRSFASADAIIEAAEKVRKVVFIGAGFIGMEGAASLRSRGLEVSVITPEKIPFAKQLGEQIGTFFRDLHEKNGVQFYLGTQATAFEGETKVEAVVLDSGERVAADMVIAGIGVEPATAMLDGMERQKDGGVLTDRFLRVATDVFAAGDIAHVPQAHESHHVRIEHWRWAQQLGRTAAHNMAGIETPLTAIPFFWTTHFGITLQYVGHAHSWDEIYFDGEVANESFLAFYIREDCIEAVAGVNRDTELAHMEQVFHENRMPSASVLKEKGLMAAFPMLGGS